MRAPFRSLRCWAVLAAAAPGLASSALAEYPPEPPATIRLVQLEPVPDPQLGAPDLVPVPPVFGPELPANGLTPIEVPEADVEEYARGSVHESFADLYEANPTPSEIVALKPPEPVDELPPDQIPTGDNVQWITGYWAWDIEANDHMWISGVWRNVPPGRRWVRGYWAQVAGGYQWINGLWIDARSQELAYVPQPPESLEIGPNIPAPTEEHAWIPGSWTYVQEDYRWSPGFWDQCQTDYMWVPNQYQWTPSGCIYVPGYRDYRFARRGCLFAPVRFRNSFADYGRPCYYRPRHIVNMSGFVIHLFVRPRCRSLYYGNYYGDQYAQFGYSPWFRRGWGGHHYRDPVLDFYRCDSRRSGIDFYGSVNTWHNRYASNPGLRPPHLVRDQGAFLALHKGDRTAELAVMTNRLDDVVRGSQSGRDFRHVDDREMAVMRDVTKVNRTIETARRQVELDGRGLINPSKNEKGEIVDLRPRDARDGNKGGRLDLGELPESIREKTKASIDTAEQLRERVERGEKNIRVIGRTPDGEQPKIDKVRDLVDQQREERSSRNGQTPNEETPRMKDRGQPSVVDGDPAQGDGKSRIDDLRKQVEERKNARNGATGREIDPVAPKLKPEPDSNPVVGRVREESPKPVGTQPDGRANSSQERIDQLRQQVEARKAARNAEVDANRQSGGNDNGVPRSITRPDNGSTVNPERPQRIDDLRKQVETRRTPDVGQPRVEREPVVRERSNPEPIRRESIPAPRIERAPVERAPREIPQQRIERAPVERAIPQQRIERAPVERAPREVSPPRMERAPVERAPRDSGSSGGSSRRKGKD